MEISNSIVSNNKELPLSSKQESIQKVQLIRIDEVSAITTLAKSTINLWVAQSKFPKPIVLSSTVKVWKLRSVNDWIETYEET